MLRTAPHACSGMRTAGRRCSHGLACHGGEGVRAQAAKAAGGPTRVENAKVALVQFCISPPKTDLENNVIISDYAQMDRRELGRPGAPLCGGAP